MFHFPSDYKFFYSFQSQIVKHCIPVGTTVMTAVVKKKKKWLKTNTSRSRNLNVRAMFYVPRDDVFLSRPCALVRDESETGMRPAADECCAAVQLRDGTCSVWKIVPSAHLHTGPKTSSPRVTRRFRVAAAARPSIKTMRPADPAALRQLDPFL